MDAPRPARVFLDRGGRPRSWLLPSIRPFMTTLSSGLGEIHPSKSHHIVELKARCANRDDRRRSPTGPATTLQNTLTVLLRSPATSVLVTPSSTESRGLVVPRRPAPACSQPRP